MIGITQRELLLEMREDIRGLKATVDVIAKDQALGVERRAAMQRSADSIYERITVAGPEIVGVRLTPAAYAHGLALALPDKVELARPTGIERAVATIVVRVPILRKPW